MVQRMCDNPLGGSRAGNEQLAAFRSKVLLFQFYHQQDWQCGTSRVGLQFDRHFGWPKKQFQTPVPLLTWI